VKGSGERGKGHVCARTSRVRWLSAAHCSGADLSTVTMKVVLAQLADGGVASAEELVARKPAIREWVGDYVRR
jgi:hypothetical protein